MANDPGAGEGGAPSVPSITYANNATGSGTGLVSGGTTARARSVTTRATSRTTAKAVQDTSGTALSSADAAGFGLNRPYLGWEIYRTADETTPPLATTSATFVALWTAAAEPQHPKISIMLKVVTGVGTTGEVRLRDRVTGTVVAGPLSIGAATTIEQALEGNLINPTLTGAGGAMKVDIEARRTAGANAVSVAIIYALGKGG